MIDFIRRVFRGEFGLTKTFWFLGVSFILCVSIPFNLITKYFLVHKSYQYPIFTSFEYGLGLIQFLLFFLVGIAIIRSTGFERKRGLWGWVTILFILGWFSVVIINYLSSKILLNPLTEMQVDIRIDYNNDIAPVEVSKGVVFLKNERTENVLRNYYSVEGGYVTTEYDDETKKVDCENNRPFFGVVSEVHFIFTHTDGKIVKNVLLREDCE